GGFALQERKPERPPVLIDIGVPAKSGPYAGFGENRPMHGFVEFRRNPIVVVQNVNPKSARTGKRHGEDSPLGGAIRVQGDSHTITGKGTNFRFDLSLQRASRSIANDFDLHLLRPGVLAEDAA